MRGFSRNHRHRDIGSLFPLPPSRRWWRELLTQALHCGVKVHPEPIGGLCQCSWVQSESGGKGKRTNLFFSSAEFDTRHFACILSTLCTSSSQSNSSSTSIRRSTGSYRPPSFGLPAHTTQHGPADQAIWRTRHRDDSRRHHLGRLPDLVSPVPIQRPRERSTLLSTPTGLKIPESPIRHEADRTTTSDKQYPSRKLERRRRRFGPSHRSRPGGYEVRARRAHWNLVVSLSCGTAPTGLDSGP